MILYQKFNPNSTFGLLIWPKIGDNIIIRKRDAIKQRGGKK